MRSQHATQGPIVGDPNSQFRGKVSIHALALYVPVGCREAVMYFICKLRLLSLQDWSRLVNVLGHSDSDSVPYRT